MKSPTFVFGCCLYLCMCVCASLWNVLLQSVAVCLSIFRSVFRVCHSSCRVLSRVMNVQASVSFSSRVCEQNIYLCANSTRCLVCVCVCAKVCARVCVPLTSIDMGVYPLRPLSPWASPAKYAIKNFTLEHANYGARQLAAATGLRVCIAMAISVHIFIATFLHVFVFLDSAKC